MSSYHLKTKISEFIKESNYNYHIGKINDLTKIEPYYSDNKHFIRGRDTGHFGSGMYFSTYKIESSLYINHDEKHDESELIQICDGVYRVDFDIYKNLYRVYNNKHGDILFNTLRMVNGMYSLFEDYYKYHESLSELFSKRYIILKQNSKELHLKCPEYKDFIKMCKALQDDNNDLRSMSTVFMEFNGFNGVNVSDIPKYDNTTHGSVIYDLSKSSVDFEKVNPRIDSMLDIEYNGSDYITGNYLDIKKDLLAGKDAINRITIDNFLVLDRNTQIYILKRYQYFLDDDIIDKLDDVTKSVYFKSLPNKFKNNNIKGKVDKWFLKSLIDNNQFEILFNPELKIGNHTLFAIAIDVLYQDDIDMLLSKINRELTDDEKKFL